ncbi:hypothetical protein GQ53DRAFT_748838 [Thozetella sp. PMI_491]|nr:hypothetical protein GQ53DRAFT_748838 [Thozetella sp. PMI_491]
MPALIIPSRSSRHRAACFALYRALLRLVPPIPLPPDVATGLGPKNPIKYQIRKAFARNKSDISLRLVIASLQSGYNFLSVLKAARDTKSPEYASILAFLHKNKADVLAFREAAALAPSPPALLPGTIPLLTKLPPLPGSTVPRYEPTRRPLPLSQIKGGVRKVPHLGASGGVPFLRLGKPQSPRLSRIIRQKLMMHQKRINTQHRLADEMMTDAKLEDDWDGLMRRLGVRDGLADRTTFSEPVEKALQEVGELFQKDLDDRVARGEALWKLVLEERALAQKEAQERALAQQETQEPALAQKETQERALAQKEAQEREEGKRRSPKKRGQQKPELG